MDDLHCVCIVFCLPAAVQQRTVAQGRKAVSTSDRQDFGARLLQFNKQLAARGFGKGPSVLK